MPNVTINSTPYANWYSGFSAGVLTAGVYYLDPGSKLGKPPSVGGKTYREFERVFPGVDGVGIVRNNFESLLIEIDLILVDSTRAGVGTKRAAIDILVTQLARYTITMPDGQAYQGCRCASMLERWNASVASKFCSLCSLSFRQRSFSN